MRSHLNKLSGKCFKYCGINYDVVEVKVVNYKAVIKTNRQIFVKTETEMNAFMDDIEILGKVGAVDVVLSTQTAKEEWKPAKVVSEAVAVFNTEIVAAESAAQKLSNMLMEMFESLAGSPSEDDYKKASAMVNVSNSIVNVQMAQIKFLSLKK